MGFLDIFRKKTPKVTHSDMPEPYYASEHILRNITDDGKLQIDYIEKLDFKKDYDSTRLVLETIPENINGYRVYTGKVSWYNQKDAIMLDGNDSRHIGLTVRMAVEPNLLRTNDEYVSWVMKGLLNKNRVRAYHERGLIDNPDVPCGNYVGGIEVKADGSFKKVFDNFTGTYVHNMPAVRQVRAQHQERKRIEKAKQARIEELNKELHDLDSLYSDARF